MVVLFLIILNKNAVQSVSKLLCVNLDCTCEFSINHVVVHANSHNYNTAGTFACSKGGKLFQRNGDQFELKMTTCLFSAKWENEDVFQCWNGKVF